MRRLFLCLCLIFMTVKGAEVGTDIDHVIRLFNQYESILMSIKGVEGVGIEMCEDGKECLKVYTSVPVEQVKPSIPEELKKERVELEYIGGVEALE